ncbi:NAD-dependent epimerase/dehydratase family protein [bacterium]|nr:NAD-dependent epimerase/dehydratase family protein [bacterium]
MDILITGGTGFIGSHLVERLLSLGHSILCIDNYATSRRDTLASSHSYLEILEANIADGGQVDAAFDRFQPDLVIHCAASYKDPDNWREDILTNTLGTTNIVQASKHHKIQRLIYFQTALCYGNFPTEQPIPLNHSLNPESSYAISKTAGEQYIALSGIDFISFRLANVYGPRNLSGPIPTFYHRLSQDKSCFAVNTRRDFVFIDDLVEVVTQAIRGKGNSGYYHISSGSDYSIRELYDAVAAALNIDRPVEERERGADDAPTILLDPSKTQQDFGWQASTSLQDGIRKAVEWYQLYGVAQTYTHLKMKD